MTTSHLSYETMQWVPVILLDREAKIQWAEDSIKNSTSKVSTIFPTNQSLSNWSVFPPGLFYRIQPCLYAVPISETSYSTTLAYHHCIFFEIPFSKQFFLPLLAYFFVSLPIACYSNSTSVLSNAIR